MKFRVVWFVLLAWMPLSFVAVAQESIKNYDVVVQVRPDGSLDVTENITVHAMGLNIRRGIYRDFPTRYKDRLGNSVKVDLKVLSVERDGKPEPWFTEPMRNGIRINTGNDDRLATPADYQFSLRYRTTRQLGFFAEHDELYWNAIGTGWSFPISAGIVEVHLPQPVKAVEMQLDLFTGRQGETHKNAIAEFVSPGVARWHLTQPLRPGEGLTIVLGFPKGLVAAPTAVQRVRWFLSDNRGVLVGLLGLLALLAYCLRRWVAVGRDPEQGVIITRYEPPTGYAPSGLRLMQRYSYDDRCFSADVLQLAVNGHLLIHREGGKRKPDWELEKLDEPTPPEGTEAILLDRLFPNSSTRLKLKDTNVRAVQVARLAHNQALIKRFEPALFQRHFGSVVIAGMIALLSAVLAFKVSGGNGVLAIIGVILIMLGVLVWFALAVRAPTLAGRALLDEIEGFKMYLSVAERDDLARIRGPGDAPQMDAERYQRLLPYAVALEVEDAWTSKFTLAVGVAAAAAATQAVRWYQGGPISDLGKLSHAVGTGLTSQIAASSSPPGSSSGGGGGGSSGGGGGGGGGGGR